MFHVTHKKLELSTRITRVNYKQKTHIFTLSLNGSVYSREELATVLKRMQLAIL